MAKMEKLLIKAENSRWKCTGCGNTIFKGELLFRSILRAWRDSHTVNLCRKCIIRMFLEYNVGNKELVDIKKEMMMESL